MKNKLLMDFIVILIISGIIVIQYQVFRLDKTIIANDSGLVKSAHLDLTNQAISTFENNLIQSLPQKTKNFREANIGAHNYILLDAPTSYPLARKDSSIVVPIASTTKIMTAIIVLEKYNLKDVVTVSPKAATQIGSDVFLRSNEKLSVESLLYALLIQSGNDAAYALAEYYPGGVEEFVREMNKKAEYLGLKNSHFQDPAGLNDEGKSTAFDLAILAAYALRNPKFAEIVKIPETTIYSSDNRLEHKLETSNRLLKGDHPLFLPSVIGVKTGFTPVAGHCLVAAAEKDGRKLVSVVLNTYENTVEASAKESKKLFQWAFNNYQF